MAAQLKINSVVATTALYVWIVLLSIHYVQSDRTAKKIYIELKSKSSCIRQLNATNQLGCTSSSSGNVGIVHYIQTPKDFDWILSEGPNPPYIAVLDRADFNGTSALRLKNQKHRVNGIMVLNLENATNPKEGFSSVDACPNDKSGLYRNSSDYGSCKMTVWNPAGSGLIREEIDMPLFSLTDPEDVDNVLNQCFFKFNVVDESKKVKEGFPLCAAEMTSFMNGAVDSVTCLRRNNYLSFSMAYNQLYCDPLKGRNVHTTLLDIPNNETRLPNSVILVGARADSTANFYNEYYGGDTAVAGFVGMLATMEALWKMKDVMKNASDTKDILFAFFDGEAYDYIGSSKMVYDMNLDIFPQQYSKNTDNLYVHNINLTHIDHIIELNQVALRDDVSSLWIHTDPNNRQVAEPEIEDIIDGLLNAADKLDLYMMEADKTQPLPPASAQRFLMSRSDIPTVVITDHQAHFTNLFYNSHLDKAENIDAANYPPGLNETEKYNYVTLQAERLSNLSSGLARYLFVAAGGLNLTDEVEEILTADVTLITNMLYCFLLSPRCELFYESVGPDNLESVRTAKQPFPLYIGVDFGSDPTNNLLMQLTARFTGVKTGLSKGNCKAPSNDKRYSYRYMSGNASADGTREGWCVKSLMQYTQAISPAFDADENFVSGYDIKSGFYSTWTESRWDNAAFSLRLFLLPSQEMQVSVLGTGVAVLVLSLLLAYWINSHSSLLFTPQPVTPAGATPSSPLTAAYSPMI